MELFGETSCGVAGCPVCLPSATPTEDDILIDTAVDAISEMVENAVEQAYNIGYNDGARGALDAAALSFPDDAPEEADELGDLWEGLQEIADQLDTWAPSVDQVLAINERKFENIATALEATVEFGQGVLREIANTQEVVADITEGLDERLEGIEADVTGDAAALDAQGLLLQDAFKRLDALETALRDDGFIL